MFDMNNKPYIFNLSTGRKAYLYYSQGSGILMRWQSEDGKWQDPVPAAKNGLEGFSACIDGYNGIHVLYQDYNGNILYMKYQDGVWNRKPVLHNRNQDTSDKQLHIACGESGIYAFYVIEYIGKRYLNFQDLKDTDSPAAPKTIDQLIGFPAYRVVSDTNGNMTLFYKGLKEAKKVTGYRTFDTGTLKWSGFQPFPPPHSDLTVLCGTEGLSGAIHLGLQKNAEGKYSLIHCKVLPGAGKWETITLAESEEPFGNTGIYAEEECIRFFWAEKAGITCRVSHDGGTGWDMEQKLDGFDEKHLSCFSYVRNIGGKKYEVHSATVPGSFSDTPRLAFLNLGTPPVNAPAEEDEAGSLRKTIAETLRLFSGSINDLRSSVRELGKRLDGLDAAQQQLELDMSKYGIKDKFIENDMTKIRSELGVLKTRIDEYDVVKAKSDEPKPQAYPSEKSGMYPGNVPLMPGSGFNSVTAEFLKGAKK